VNTGLRGWPWQPGGASWIEPTALAMLALSLGPASDDAAERLDEAARYMLDRRCSGGGWNFGSPVMFDQRLPARVHPTALALLALRRYRPASVMPDDLAALRRDLRLDGTAGALGWGLVALHAAAESEPSEMVALQRKQQVDGSWNGNPYQTAIAIMACRTSPAQ